MKVCEIPECDRGSSGRKRLCAMHYRRVNLTGDTGPSGPVRGGRYGIAPCAVDGCDRRYYAKDLCSLHYNRQRLTGEVGEAAARRQPAGAGNVWRWTDPKSGYVYINLPDDRSHRLLEHRYVMEQHLDRTLWPDETVHHKNGDRSDNRIENLELWSSMQPAGQRASDKLAWAREIIARYAELPPEVN